MVLQGTNSPLKNNNSPRVAEVAQHLKVCTALEDNQGLVPRKHTVAYKYL